MMQNPLAEQLSERIRSRQAVVGILGLGYVGLPLALVFSERGFPVLGFDVDPGKVKSLNQGESYIRHLDEQRVKNMARSGHFQATVDFSRLGEADVILVCVPTPLTPQRQPDMRYVMASMQKIAATLRAGQLIVLESTTYPGTTEDLVKGILEASNQVLPASEASSLTHELGRGRESVSRPRLQCGRDFFLAYSPEREDPGNKLYGTASIPKVVGGVDPLSGDLAQLLYDQVVVRTVRVANARTAEAAKLTENIFRAVNIALVNELKLIYDRMGIDIWEVLDAAETKPFGFMRFNPGPGWGGHCIPLDPFYLSWKAREVGFSAKFIELAGEINVAMPKFVIEKLLFALNERGKTVKGAKILILGVAYKKDIDDPRESPAFELIDQLLQLGAEVRYHDPHILVAPAMRTWPDLPPMESVALEPRLLSAQDAVVVVTDHSAVDYQAVLEHASLIVDTRGVYRTPSSKVIRA